MIRAKKRFGQNFLKDELVLNKIKQVIPNNTNDIVEIGCGMGDLTAKLLEVSSKKRVIGYEIDKSLYSLLCKNFDLQLQQRLFNLTLCDVVHYWQEHKTLSSNKYDLVANLPYNIGTKIVLKALCDDNCQSLIVMLQLEVAKKFLARPKDKDFSALGVISSLACDNRSEVAFVDRASFEPAPNVDSMVICLQKNKDIDKKDNITTNEEFKKFLKICFLAPRKKMITSLKGKYNLGKIKEIFKQIALNESIRSHEITPAEYVNLFKKLHH